MTAITDKELNFLRKWETRRKRKWRHLVLFAVCWGMLQIFPYFWSIDFVLAQFDPLRFISQVIISIPFGLALVWLNFNGLEKRYQEVKDNNLM